jgi:hypothetical protein
VLAGATNGLLQAEAKKYMGRLSKKDHAAALDEARAFRKAHPAGSPGALAAFAELSEIKQLAVRSLASITAGARRSHTHARRSDTRNPPGAAARLRDEQRAQQKTTGTLCSKGSLCSGMAVKPPMEPKVRPAHRLSLEGKLCWQCHINPVVTSAPSSQ